MDRRKFAGAMSLGVLAAATGPGDAAALLAQAAAPAGKPAADSRLRIAMLVYPKMILLDLTGPMTVFNLMRANLLLVGKSKEPVATDVGIPIAPAMSYDECPADLDVLFVPGGLDGTVAMMEDAETLKFIADRGSRARFVTSVCTGSLLLGAAGLLRGYRATSHWYVRELLELMGAKADSGRVVIDRNRITGGGVTAGLDFGLQLASSLRGEEQARTIQLVLEYDPKPPFSAGTPEQAGAALTERIRQVRGPAIAAARNAAVKAGQRMGA